MSHSSNLTTEEIENFEDFMEEDILFNSDEAVLEQARARGEDPAAIARAMRASVEALIRERDEVISAAAVREDPVRLGEVVPFRKRGSRAELREGLLRGDPDLRMAARHGVDLSEDEIEMILNDLEALGALKKADGSERDGGR